MAHIDIEFKNNQRYKANSNTISRSTEKIEAANVDLQLLQTFGEVAYAHAIPVMKFYQDMTTGADLPTMSILLK